MLIIGATRCVLLVLITVGCIYTVHALRVRPTRTYTAGLIPMSAATRPPQKLRRHCIGSILTRATPSQRSTSYGPLSVCLSARHVSVCHMSDSEFYRYGWADRAQSWFWHGASFDQSYSVCCKEVRIYLQNKGISLWNFIRTLESGLKISPRHVDRCNVMST